MAVLDWLQQLLGGGDPEAAGAAQASTAMQPMTQPWLDKVLSGEMARSGIQDVNDAFASSDPVALAGSFGPSPLGIRAFHGSPHSFDRFDLSKIGTGEGAQAYGHGLYFAESEPVARSYRDKLSSTPIDHLNTALMDFSPYKQGGVEPTIDNLRDMLANHSMPSLQAAASNEGAVRDLHTMVNGHDMRSNTWSDDAVRAASRLDTHFAGTPGHMYEVDINAKPGDFLNWDKRLGEQSPQVQAALSPERLGLTPAGPVGERGYYGFTDETGRLVGRAQTQRLPEGVFNPGELGMNVYRGTGAWEPQVATEKLRQAGIPGIRYLDQGSRGAGQGSSNYVVFNDNLIQILRKYGLLPPLAAGGLLAAPGQGEAGQP